MGEILEVNELQEKKTRLNEAKRRILAKKHNPFPTQVNDGQTYLILLKI